MYTWSGSVSYTELALYGSQNEYAKTDNISFPTSEFCDGTVSPKPASVSKPQWVDANVNIFLLFKLYRISDYLIISEE